MNSRRDVSSNRKPMTGRELKRLRLKRSATVLRQRLQEESFQTNKPKADAKEQPANEYDILVQGIYEDINKDNFCAFGDNESSSTEESAATEATTNSSSVDQEQELTVTAVPISPIPRTGDHENIGNNSDVKEILQKQDNLPKQDISMKEDSVNEDKSFLKPSKYNYFGVGRKLPSTSSQERSVDDSEVKSTLATEIDFSKKPRSMKDRRKKRLKEKLKFYKFLRGEDDSAPEVCSQQILEHYEDCCQIAETKVDDNDEISVNTSSSYDTYGFDTFGFASPDHTSTRNSMSEDALSISAASALSDTFEFILKHGTSPEAEETQKNTISTLAKNFRFSMRRYARRRMSHFGDDDKSTMSTKKTASAEARRLRSLRLRVATHGRNVEPMRSLEDINEDKEPEPEQEMKVLEDLKDEGEEEEEMKALKEFECRDHSVHANENENVCILPTCVSRQSLVSELTFASEILLSKLDELSFLCGSQTALTCQSETEYDRQMNCEELDPPSVTEDPSLYFDASMKTPPRYLLNPALKHEDLEKRDDRSNWIDLSPVGQKKKENSTQAVPRATQLGPVAIDRPTQEDSKEEETKTEHHGIFGRIICLFDDMEKSDDESYESTTFSRIWREEISNVTEKNPNAVPGLMEIDSTLSAVSMEEEDYASYYIENADEYIKDLENNGKNVHKTGFNVYSC